MHIRVMLPRILFFGVVALLLLAELWFSNWSTLTHNVEGIAALLGLSVDQERTRLYILIVLDAIGGMGALTALAGCLRDRAMLRRVGAMMAALALVFYGIYQLISALTQLPPELRTTIALIGIIYIGIGIVAWIVGTRPTPDAHPAT